MILYPKVSVIMNCLNGERFLKPSLKSLIAQTYKNWELIFFDNNSTDSSKKIFYKFYDKRFKYFKSSKKLNLYHARNIAIKYSTGKYITFLDVDDLWLKNKLLEQIKVIKKKKSKFIFSNYYLLNNEIKKRTYKKKQYEGFITQNLIDNYFLSIMTVMFEKKLLNIYKLKFNNKYNIIGDFDLFLRLSRKIYMHYIHKPLAIYRYHENNYSTLNNEIYCKEIFEWRKKNLIYYKNYDFNQFDQNIDYLQIKSNLYNNKYFNALKQFLKFPLGIKKIKLFLFFFLKKKFINF